MGEENLRARLELEVASLTAQLATIAARPLEVDPAVVAIAQSTTDNVMLLDRNGVIQYINWTVPDLTPDQVRGTPATRYVGAEFHAAMRQCFTDVCNTAKPSRYETFYVSPEGKVSYWESRVAPVVRDGRVVNLVVSSSDVTAGRAAEAERQRFFTMSRDLLCVADTTGYFKRVNPAFERTLGFSETELLAAPFVDFVHPEDREVTEAAVAQLSAGQEVVDFQNRYRCKDGSYRWLSWRAISEPDNSRLIYAVGRDITDTRLLEAQLRQSQKMDAIGQLAGGIAHDFNNLLMAIQGNVQLALHPRGTEGPAPFLKEIGKAGDRAAALTRQLLAFSRQQPIAATTLDVGALANDLMNLLRRVIDERVRIQLSVAPGDLLVRGDTGQLEQVIINLCVNARDAIPAAGTVAIEVTAPEINQAFVSEHRWARAGRFVRISVADDGSGMSNDVQERAFDPFFTTKQPGKGTGLGLATVYGIVQQHSGFIEIDSEVGRGTTVSVYLPQHVGRADARSKPDEPAAVAGNETVLVAEDDAAVLRVVVKTLEGAGYRVLTAHDGAEALRLFRAHSTEIGLVLLDVVMPNMTGPDAAAAIRAVRPEVAVVFSTGYADAEAAAALERDDTPVLHKPYPPATLLCEVRRVLDASN